MEAVNSLQAAALRYAARGISVLPLHTPTPDGCTCRNGKDCSSAGKHPRLRHGLHEASVNPRLIRHWWRRWPAANIGVATGTTLDICDIDTSQAMAVVLNLLHVASPPGPVVRTGNGWHLWYTATGLPSRVGVLPGVDWRGRGGFAVAPPSMHGTGDRYAFTPAWTGRHLPDCPPALKALLTPRPDPAPPPTKAITNLDRYTTAVLDAETRRVLNAARPAYRAGRRIRPGGRNSALNHAAFRLGQLARLADLTEGQVTEHLAAAAVVVGLPPAEARRTIASGWRAGRRHPR
ncbi:hypothetical protein Cs7R123_32160 [Catellatospora sp. TT07R-123]|uniref:bifunctional DNA primase/polymerase n=1 Tax=Catellatospora sp. TT07R-123 TaxID=2733863 RepID=UPI001B22D08D|nr:bifunctional DNA primase/polymerase [Catellatospora sp. TT07R-123]GHJ45874.1 hypothetical protein Cs7R123_32160 [Catellatospora sp. TT07R-123]